MMRALIITLGIVAIPALGFFVASAQETKVPSAEEIKALKDKYSGERDKLLKSGAAKRFLPILLDKAEDMNRRGDEALAQGRVLQATELYRQARWQLPYQSPNVPEKFVARILGNLRLRHGQEINDVAFSPDGKILATASRDRTVKIWDLANGHELLTYTGHTDYVRRVAFRPDGKMIASAGGEKDIKLWDPSNGKHIRTIKGLGTYVTSIAFSKDGKTLAVGNNDKALRLYEVDTGNLKRNMDQQFNAMVLSLAFSPDGSMLATGVGDSYVKVYQYPQILDASTFEFWGKQEDAKLATSVVAFSPDGRTLARVGPWDLKLYNTPQPGAKFIATQARRQIVAAMDLDAIKYDKEKQKFRFNCMAFSKDGKTIFTGGVDGLIRLWDSETGQAKGIFKGHNDEIRALAFNEAGTQLASASSDFTVRLWTFDVVLQARDFSAHSEPVWSACFSPDGYRFVSASADKTAKVVEIATAKPVFTLNHQAGVTVATYSPDGKVIASGGGDKAVKLWDANNGQLIKALEGHSGTITGLGFSADSKKIVSGSVDKRIKIWDTAAFTELLSIDDLGTIATSVVFSPNNRFLACGGTDQNIRILDVKTGKAVAQWHAHGIAVTGLAYSPNGLNLASCGADSLVRVWPVANAGATSITLSGHSGPLSGVAFRKDNVHLVSCGSDMLVKLWKLDAGDGKEVQTFRGHSDWVTSVNFSKDGYFFLSTSVDRGVKIWEITDREIPLLAEHTGAVEAVAVSPDGKLIASGGSDRTIKIWDREKGIALTTLVGHIDPIHALAFADNKTLVSSSGDPLSTRDRGLRLWNVETAQELPKQPGHKQNFTNLISHIPYMVVTADGKKLIAWQPLSVRGSKLYAWDLASGNPLFEIKDGEPDKKDSREILAASFTPDGKRAATGARDGSIRLWDLEKKEKFPGGDWFVFDKDTALGDLAFAPDGNTLVATSEKGDVKVLDVAKKTVLHTLTKAHPRRINGCLVSPDGKRFATVGQDNIIKVFDLASAKLLREWDTGSTLQDRGAFVYNIAFTPDSRSLVTANANTSLFVLEVP